MSSSHTLTLLYLYAEVTRGDSQLVLLIVYKKQRQSRAFEKNSLKNYFSQSGKREKKPTSL